MWKYKIIWEKQKEDKLSRVIYHLLIMRLQAYGDIFSFTRSSWHYPVTGNYPSFLIITVAQVELGMESWSREGYARGRRNTLEKSAEIR